MGTRSGTREAVMSIRKSTRPDGLPSSVSGPGEIRQQPGSTMLALVLQTAETTRSSLSGTIQGHVFPGALFVLWAGSWTYHVVAGPGPGALRAGPLEGDRLMSMAKLILPIIGILGELVPGGFAWKPSMINNYQHALMYVPFMVAGVVDLLALSGRISWRATYVAAAGALLNAGFLFAGHGHAVGLPHTVHQLLVDMFGAAAVLLLLEVRYPTREIAWLRIWSVYVLGLWLIEIAWILYLSGWGLVDPVSQMKTYLFASATGVAAAVFLLVVHQMAGATGPAAQGRSADHFPAGAAPMSPS